MAFYLFDAFFLFLNRIRIRVIFESRGIFLENYKIFDDDDLVLRCKVGHLPGVYLESVIDDTVLVLVSC